MGVGEWRNLFVIMYFSLMHLIPISEWPCWSRGKQGEMGVHVDAGVEGEKGAKGGRDLSVIVFYIFDLSDSRQLIDL